MPQDRDNLKVKEEKEVERLLKILDRKTDEKLPEAKQTRLSSPNARRQNSGQKEAQNEASPKVLPVNRRRKVERFMEAHLLSSGPWYLESFLLYYCFLAWSNKGKKKKTIPLSFKNFNNILKIRYKYRITKKGTLYYGLSKDLRREYLTPQREVAIRKWHNLDGTKKKKEVQKIPDQIPST